MQNFFWPCSYIDNTRYCKKLVKKKGRLVPIPPIGDPFSKLAIDIVGPLPMTEIKTGTFWYV